MRHFSSSLLKDRPISIDEEEEVIGLNRPPTAMQETIESVRITMFSEDELEEEELLPRARPRFLSTPVHPCGSEHGFVLVRGDTLKRRRASVHFQQAMQRDAASEVHPGWQSLRRLHKVIGYVWPELRVCCLCLSQFGCVSVSSLYVCSVLCLFFVFFCLSVF